MQREIFGALLVCAATCFAVTAAAQTPTGEYNLEIAPQSIQGALLEFSKQTGVTVSLMLTSGDQKSLVVAPLSGRYTLESALNEMLAPSGLVFMRVNEKTIAVTEKSPTRNRRIGETAATDRPHLQRLADLQFRDGGANERLAAAAAPAPEHTRVESNERRFEEVIVTAQKRSERLQDVPVPVTAVNADTLLSTSQLRLEDYYQKLPGIGLTLAGNGSEPMVVIRGMTTTSSGNPTAGVVIDEVQYGRSRSLAFNMSAPDIDPSELVRVEVLRGPQGTLYGASSIGGLLKFVTVDPSTEGFTGRVNVGSTYVHYGDDVGHSVRGAVNVPLTDTAAMRLSGFTVRDPGYVDNAETGEKDVNSRDSDGGRLSLLWRPSANFSVKLGALIQDSLRQGMSDSDITLGSDLQRRELRGVGGYDRKSRAYSATVTGSIGSVELVSATGYLIDEMSNSVESPNSNGQANTFFPGSGRASTATWMENKKFTQELRATLPIGERLNWLFGVFYTEEQDQYRVNVYANNSNGAIRGLLRQNSALPGSDFEERAAFTNLTVDITDRVDVQFGGRFSESEQVFARASILNGANPVNATPTFFQTSRSDDSAFTYLVTPRFRVSRDLMAYARVASGYRIGGPNFNCGVLPTLPCEFDPDKSKNYEIGVKGTVLNQKLAFDASVYYIDWENIQIGLLTVPGGPANITYTGNASRAKSEGVELSIESSPLDGLKLSGWVAYNEAVLTEPFPIGNGSSIIQAGTRLPHSSRWSGGVAVEQEFPLLPSIGATGLVGVDASYVGERPGTLSNTNMLRAKPSYVQTNLRIGAVYDTWTANVFVNNVTDKRGVLRGGDDAIGVNLINYIQPRTIGFSLSKSF